MPLGPTLDLVSGTDRDFRLQVRTAQGDAYDPTDGPQSPFLGTDTLAARLWQGADTATLLTPTASWADATGVASFTVGFAAGDTAALAPGLYRLQVLVARGGKSGPVFDGRLRLAQAPGAGSVPLAFTVLSDLTKYAPWLETLQDDLDETAFAVEQNRATMQLVNDLVDLWQPPGLRPQIGQPGWNATNLFGSGGTPPSKWLRDNLIPLVPNSTPPADVALNRQDVAANLIQPRVSTALLLYDEVLEVCARRAIAMICERQVSAKMDDDWLKLARMHHRMAASLSCRYRYMIDLATPQQGWAAITIHGGAASLR